MVQALASLSYREVDISEVISLALTIATPESVIVWNASDIVRVNQLNVDAESAALDVAAALVFVAAIESQYGEESRDIALSTVEYLRQINDCLDSRPTDPEKFAEYSLSLLHFCFLNLEGEQDAGPQ